MTSTGKTPSFDINRKGLGLRELAPLKVGASTTRAALALYTWTSDIFIRGADRGIRAPRFPENATHPGPKNNATFRIIKPLGDNRTLKAYAFIDNSVLVGIDILNGDDPHMIFLPKIFRLRQYHRQNDPYLAISNAKRDKYSASISFHATQGETDLKHYSHDEIDADDGLYNHPTLKAVRSDLSALLSAFDALPWIVESPDGPLPSSDLTDLDTLRLGLPKEAVGDRAYWPDFLPFTLVTRFEKTQIEAFAQDFNNWLMIHFSDKLKGCAVTVRHFNPEKDSQGDINTICSAYYHLRNDVKQRGQEPFGWVGINDALKDPTTVEFPVHADRMAAIDFTDLDYIKHRVMNPALCHKSTQEISAHEKLRLMKRFGNPKPGLFEAAKEENI